MIRSMPTAKKVHKYNQPMAEATNTNFTFFECSLDAIEWTCLLVVMVSSILLQISPILHSGAATILLVATALISWMTPVSGFAYIAAAQILPFPPDSLINPAQIGFYTWVLVAPLRYRPFDLKYWHVLLAFLPWFAWFTALSGQNTVTPSGEYAKVVYYGIIGVQLANAAKGHYTKCLMGLCIGCLAVSFGYWAQHLGLPVALSKYGGSRAGFFRLGGVRADSVMVWPPLLMGCFGLLGSILAYLMGSPHRNFPPRYLFVGALGIMFITVPCLMATMTNGAFGGFFLMSIFLLVMYFIPENNKLLSAANRNRFGKLFLLIVVLIVMMYLLNLFRIADRVAALFDFYSSQSKELGVAASRTGVWEQSISLMLKYPFTGLIGNDAMRIRFRSINGDVESGYLAHNVFLDNAVQTGIPSMLMLAGAFFMPLLEFSKRKIPIVYFSGFFCFYFACFIFWMTLSFPFYKTFWSFWVLLYIAILNWDKRVS